ncbi:hypothetical protein VXS03_08025 [Photobacterium sp. S4TG1]|uniref:hypothetical protein n=1 Tax=Photobacterium sp. S4TG1 TaxID=3114587 RepID=UPI002E18ACFC|nr:hypothetical protein [Photobacterium sp. S4TG1]
MKSKTNPLYMSYYLRFYATSSHNIYSSVYAELDSILAVLLQGFDGCLAKNNAVSGFI